MRKALLIFTASLLLSSIALGVPAVFPAPALNGPTGLVRIPSADVITYKNFNIAGDYGQIMGPATSEGTIAYKVNLGTFHGVEAGRVRDVFAQKAPVARGADEA